MLIRAFVFFIQKNLSQVEHIESPFPPNKSFAIHRFPHEVIGDSPIMKNLAWFWSTEALSSSFSSDLCSFLANWHQWALKLRQNCSGKSTCCSKMCHGACVQHNGVDERGTIKKLGTEREQHRPSKCQRHEANSNSLSTFSGAAWFQQFFEAKKLALTLNTRTKRGSSYLSEKLRVKNGCWPAGHNQFALSIVW